LRAKTKGDIHSSSKLFKSKSTKTQNDSRIKCQSNHPAISSISSVVAVWDVVVVAVASADAADIADDAPAGVIDVQPSPFLRTSSRVLPAFLGTCNERNRDRSTFQGLVEREPEM